MPVPQIALLSNPGSTRNKKSFDRLKTVVEATENVFHFELSNIKDVPEALGQFARTKPAMLVINGGDGTIQATLTSLLNDKPFGNNPIPPIAILPSGKTNMIAEDLGTGGAVRKVFAQLEKALRQDALENCLIKRNLIRLDLGDGQPYRYGMFFGGAGVVNGILYCRKRIYPMKLPNVLSHGLAIFSLVLSAMTGAKKETSPLYARDMRVNVKGGGILEGRYMVVIATTLDRLLLGTRPYGFDGEGGLRFSAVDHQPGAAMRAFRGLLSGNFGKKYIKGVHVRRSDQIRIKGQDPVTLDGELYEPGPGGEIVLNGEEALTFVSLANWNGKKKNKRK